MNPDELSIAADSLWFTKENADCQRGMCVIRFNHLIQNSAAKEVNRGNNALPRQEPNRGGKKVNRPATLNPNKPLREKLIQRGGMT